MNGEGCPYPGLRPFEQSDSHLFYGRGEQVDAMLATLETQNFLAVVGASGCGKSSLVRAGLLPALADGYFCDGSTDWRFVICRPSGAPYQNLANALQRTFGLWDTEAALQRSEESLTQLLRSSRSSGEHVLILVDQFEEIFRLRADSTDGDPKARASRDEAAGFVSMLMATATAAERQNLPLHVMITMRSDFIGDCDVFHGLPELLSRTQFLTPRMRRRQLEAAIVRPALWAGATVEENLPNVILNDVKAQRDQLPLLQHALRRTWELAPIIDGRRTLTLEAYRESGGVQAALSQHADQIFNKLSPEHKDISETLFRCLAEHTDRGQLARRATSISEVMAVADAARADVVKVAATFADRDCAFIQFSESRSTVEPSIIDITHEALLRQWTTLEGWLDAERQSAKTFRRVADAAARHKLGSAGLLQSPELDHVLEWQSSECPTEAWAERYGNGLPLVKSYIEASLNAQRGEKARTKRRNSIISFTALLFLLCLAVMMSSLIIDDVDAIITNHEITSLSDETSLRAWEIVSIITGLRDDLELCSQLPPQAFLDLQTTSSVIDAPETMRGAISEIRSRTDIPFRYAKRYVSIELITPTGELLPILRSTAHDTESDIRRSILELPKDQGVVKLSPIDSISLNGTDLRDAVIWGTVPLMDTDYRLVIGARVSPYSSPRHLHYIIDNESEETLFASIPGEPEKFIDSVFKSSPDVWEESFFDGQRAIVQALESARTGAIQEGLSPILRFPVQQRQSLGQPFFYLQGEALGFRQNASGWPLSDRLDYEENLRIITSDFQSEGVIFHGLAPRGISTVRLLSRSKASLEALRSDIEKKIRQQLKPNLQSVFEGVEWRWQDIVYCNHADVCTVVIPVRTFAGVYNYRFINSTFREELSVGVSRELEPITKLAFIMSFGMAILFYAISSFVHRMR